MTWTNLPIDLTSIGVPLAKRRNNKGPNTARSRFGNRIASVSHDCQSLYLEQLYLEQLYLEQLRTHIHGTTPHTYNTPGQLSIANS
jgi:hypothetical protein